MVIRKVKANYFDNCDECGDVTNRVNMYEVDANMLSDLRLCYECAVKLKEKLVKALEDDDE